jgi:hypothetical protein
MNLVVMGVSCGGLWWSEKLVVEEEVVDCGCCGGEVVVKKVVRVVRESCYVREKRRGKRKKIFCDFFCRIFVENDWCCEILTIV